VADRFLILGLIMVFICAVSWVIVPVGKFLRYLASSPKIERVRPRAVAVTCGLLVFLLILLSVIPFPSHFRAPGVVQARQRTAVLNEVAGIAEVILVEPGTRVEAGQPLLRLANPELTLELMDARARLQEVRARLLYSMNAVTSDIKPLNKRIDALTNRIEKLSRDRENLTIRSRHQGTWVAPGIRDFIGRHLEAGSPLGLLVDTSSYEFAATVLQEDADKVFTRNPRGAEIRLRGEAGTSTRVEKWRVVPGGSRSLPSAALSWASGGDVAVSPKDPNLAVEPFFEVRAPLPSANDVSLIHGRSGRIRFDLEPEPLLPRWMRRLRQLLQKRYQL
jgi:putative peptide zinc metalloprotease protein